MKAAMFVSAIALVGGACAGTDEEETSVTSQAISDPHTNDALNGGVQDFFLLPQLVAVAPTYPNAGCSDFNGGTNPGPCSFNNSFATPSGSTRLKVRIQSLDCTTFAVGSEVAGSPFSGVALNSSLQAYRLIKSVSQLGLSDGQCVRVSPLLDDAPLGFRDAKVTNGTPPAGLAQWRLTPNIVMSWSIRNSFDQDGDGVLNHKDQCPNTPSGTVVDATGCVPVFNCTCSNGTASTGSACEVNGSEDCASCNAGFHLAGSPPAQSCAANICTCSNGTAATGAACTTDGAAICASCNSGFVLSGGACLADADGDGTPNVSDSCPNDARFQTTTGLCGCNAFSIDTDEDGTPDSCSNANSCTFGP